MSGSGKADTDEHEPESGKAKADACEPESGKAKAGAREPESGKVKADAREPMRETVKADTRAHEPESGKVKAGAHEPVSGKAKADAREAESGTGRTETGTRETVRETVKTDMGAHKPMSGSGNADMDAHETVSGSGKAKAGGRETVRDIRVSVRDLVEFVMRSGDLDNRRTAAAEKDAMLAGGRLHRKLQRRMGAGYQAEVAMRHTVDEGEFSITVEGRADGVITDGTGVTIDEIKGIYMDPDRLEEPVPVHLAQARCYGYIYCADHGLNAISVQVTYCSLETEELRRFKEDLTFAELEEWFRGLIHEYVKWARYLYEHGLRRDESLRELPFPYAYRPGQKELAVSVYKSISRRRNLFIQAPTGVGKTLSVIYPSLKAMGEGLAEKLFYLTARTIARSVAEETFSILREAGMYLKSVTITAKEKLCFLEKPSCNPDDCPYAEGHFDRVNDAVYEVIHREFGITREVLLRYAEKYRVCPFEFCLDVSSWVDAVICDYNYVFDPNVRLRRYFADGVSGEYLFLVDEAHNLVSRGRDMYSAALVKEDVLQAKRFFAGKNAKLVRLLDRTNRQLLEMKRESEGCVVRENINSLLAVVQSLYGELETYLEENREPENREQTLDFYFELRDFLMVSEGMDEAYTIYSEILGDGRFMVRLFCMNPAGHLKECLQKGRSTIFFSATLLPVNYYKELLSGNPEDYAVYAESPFPGKNRLLLVARDVSSRYKRRNLREYEKVADYIRSTALGRRGNYMVFFPSYAYLNAVMEVWERREKEGWPPVPGREADGFHREADSRPVSGSSGESAAANGGHGEMAGQFESGSSRGPGDAADEADGAQTRSITVLCQDSRMSEARREAFLRAFEEEREDTLVAFCVMGGVFSEGIDLKAERLIGAVVVGAGLPMVCTEQELLKVYFDRKGQKGFDYAYRYPGMNKVQQAAGRVIRSMDDRGVIVLLDDRFLREDYQALFPREWRPFRVVDRTSAAAVIADFWNRQEMNR